VLHRTSQLSQTSCKVVLISSKNRVNLFCVIGTSVFVVVKLKRKVTVLKIG